MILINSGDAAVGAAYVVVIIFDLDADVDV